MVREFRVISSGQGEERAHRILTGEEKMKHLMNVSGAILDDAQETWSEIWKEMRGNVTDGYMILPEAEKGFKPPCGWPEFLEKIWLLKHYIDSAKKFTQQKV